MRRVGLGFLIFLVTADLVMAAAEPMEPRQGAAEAAAEKVEEFCVDPLASILTAMNVPARALACGFTGFMALIVMMASGGARHADAGQMMQGACGGPWVITPDMIHGEEEKPPADN
jgi:hypothetical protein